MQRSDCCERPIVLTFGKRAGSFGAGGKPLFLDLDGVMTLFTL